MQARRIVILLCQALAAWLPLRPQPAGADILTDSYILVREGNADNALLGFSVATAGDVNGDGYSDVLLSGPQNNGMVWCYYGGVAPGGAVEFTEGWVLTGGAPNALLNARVSPAGDVNGDGYDDVLIGAPNYANGEFAEGGVFVYLGAASGLSPTPQRVLEGDIVGAALGSYLDTAGDVNGDGYDDIVVGSPNYSNGESFEGRALVYMGSAAGIAATPAWSFEGNSALAYFGKRVAGTGDVNGDGYDDILVSAPELTNGENGEGRVYLFIGSESGLATSPSWTHESNIVGGRAGWGLGCAGDVDGDGYSDIVFDVGTNNPSFSSVRVFFGGPTGPGTTLNRMFVSGDGAFGDMVYTAGDINGDGLSDLIAGNISENSQAGKVTILGGVKTGNGTLFPVLAERYGAQTGEQFGADCRSAGDVNGDGFGDVIVGAPRYDNGNTDEGSVRVYLGRASVPNFSAAWNPTGSSGSWLGASVAQGDWNGDGYTDIAVGLPNYASGGTTPGRVAVWYGAYWGYTTGSNWFVTGAHDEGLFGHAVANAGDIDNDGCEELIVGEPNYGTFDYPQIGAVHIFKGSPGGLGATPWWYQAGGIQPGQFGYAVSGAGDVNGDGYADVVVGAPFYEFPPLFERGGATYLYLGSAAGLATSAVWSGFGGATGDLFGYSVAGVGDMNADGFGEIAVGAPQKESSPGLANEGFFYVLHGAATGINGATGPFRGYQAGAQFGYRVAAGGDVNGDGYSDLLIGAPFYDESGQADRGFVWALGGNWDLVGLYDLWSRIGTNAGDRMGWAVAGGGDLNGDGYSDVAVGATMDDFGTPNGGAVYIHFGNAYPGVDATTAAVNWGTDSQGQFGYALSMAGDGTGDGFADLVVGQPTYLSSDFGRAYCFYGAREGMPAAEDGTMRNPRQLKGNVTTLIQARGASDSPFEFHFRTNGRSARGRATLDFQYQIAKQGEAWNGTPISAGSYDTGQPGGGGSYVAFNLAVTNLVPNTPYRWRTRFVGDSPYFPLSQWFYLAGNAPGEADLRTGAGPTGLAGPRVGDANGADEAGTLRFSQVGPNPCRDEATIRFSLPAAGAARLTVHDVTGRRVATLVDRELGSGAQTASWDTRDEHGRPVGAGVYLLRLERGADRSAAKIVVQR